ncbi:hypothetical protein VFPPC_15226 [Pochonia chlamydosporia 170]|uniref:Uncharacterized protein n=1 Tax=Pochonia chlamydosporia 170 TaxID=1380566 RepID=A0A179G6D1_METCM|nr:hypothetical protein VFPPC_15226 [Pochonia chlamydosporia 170]OAQ72961.1 hypothetical protein VFPPC_15226 [Pochonia chlamydosporia 170]
MPSPHQTHDGMGTNRNRHWAMQHVTPIGVQRPPDATQACTTHAECVRACVCVLPVACVHALRNDCIISTWAPCGCGLPLAERQSCLGAWVWGLAAGTICWRPSHLTVQDGLSLDRHPFAVKGDHLWLTCLLCFFFNKGKCGAKVRMVVPFQNIPADIMYIGLAATSIFLIDSCTISTPPPVCQPGRTCRDRQHSPVLRL